MAATATSTGSANWSVPGTWAITGLGTQTAADGVFDNGTGVLTPTVSPGWTVDALIGRYIDLDGTAYAVTDNDATTATLTAGPASATYTYKVCGAPLATDIVVIATGHTVADDVARIPATAGLLASLTAVGTGKITVDMTNLGGGGAGQTAGIYVTGPITGGTAGTPGTTGFIHVSGADADAVFNVVASNVKGGTAAHATGLYVNTTGTVNVTSPSEGGGTTYTPGIKVAAGTFNQTGNMTGGTGAASPGTWLANPAGITAAIANSVITGGSYSPTSSYQGEGFINNNLGTVFTNVSLVCSANNLPMTGAPPAVWNITDKANYISMPTVNLNGGGAAAAKFSVGTEPGKVFLDTPGFFYGATGGESLLGTRVEPAVAKVLTTSGNWGDPDDWQVGTYNVVAQANALYTGTPYFGVTDSLLDGTWHPPVQGDVLRQADGGTGYGVDSGTYGTWVMCPITSALSTGSAYYGAAGTQYGGSYVQPDAAWYWIGKSYGIAQTGEMRASNVPNLSAAVLVYNTSVDDLVGAYPTTATSKAEQLAADKAAVTAEAANILDGTTILTIAGTFDLAAAEAAAAAAQLAGDIAEVELQADHILLGETILTVDGTYDAGGAVWPAEANVWEAETAWGPTGAEYAGTLTLSAAADVWHGADPYGVGGNGSTPDFHASDIDNCEEGNVRVDVTIDDILGTYGMSPPIDSPDTTNIVWAPLEHFRQLLASSPTYQTHLGVDAEEVGTEAGVTAAKAKIYIDGLPAATVASGLPDARPYSVISLGPNTRVDRVDSSAMGTRGTVVWEMEAAAAAGKPETAIKDFLKTLGDTLTEMITLAATAGYLCVHHFRVEVCWRSNEEIAKNWGDFFYAQIHVDWGVSP